MTIFTTVNDLRIWVSERSGEDTSPEDNESIVSEIIGRNNFPVWGEDAAPFLATLPEYLVDIVVE